MNITITNLDLTAVGPQITLIGFALLILIINSYLKEDTKRYLSVLTIFALLLALNFSLKFLDATSGIIAFQEALIADKISAFFNLLFIIISFLVLLLSEDIKLGEYYSLILIATSGMMFIAQSLDLITVFLGIELLSLSCYILCGINTKNKMGVESALKYLLLGAFASCFLLLGIALIYAATGTTKINILATTLSQGKFEGMLLYLSTLFILVGISFKIALVPFHQWVPDVYEGAPTPVTAFMSAGVKAAGFVVFLRVISFTLQGINIDLIPLLSFLAILTMTVGNIMALIQNNIKRLLAYSSIAHAGYILVGIIAGGKIGISAVLFYLLLYAPMVVGAFGVGLAFSKVTSERSADKKVEASQDTKSINFEENYDIPSYAGIAYRYPYLALAMTIFLFSLTGIPPFSGFIGKFYLFSAAVKSNLLPLAIIGVLNSVISAYYYLRVTVYMYMEEKKALPLDELGKASAPPLKISFLVLIAITLCLFATIYLGIFPSFFLHLAQFCIGG